VVRVRLEEGVVNERVERGRRVSRKKPILDAIFEGAGVEGKSRRLIIWLLTKARLTHIKLIGPLNGQFYKLKICYSGYWLFEVYVRSVGNLEPATLILALD
jgi:hypothetical protein